MSVLDRGWFHAPRTPAKRVPMPKLPWRVRVYYWFHEPPKPPRRWRWLLAKIRGRKG